MGKKVSNMEELQAAIMPTLAKMVDKLADDVYKTLNYFLITYYASYIPVYYDRMFDFLHSAVKVKPKIKGNKVTAYVFIDYEAMDNYRDATGFQVVDWANQGLHGGMDLGNNTPHVWDDTVRSMISSGKLLDHAVKYLKSKGFTVS